MEMGGFASGCQYIVSPHCRIGNRAITQTSHSVLKDNQIAHQAPEPPELAQPRFE